MINKLPMFNPTIQTYPKHAHITSILAKHNNFNEWLFNNHIQIFCLTYNGETNHDTYLDTYEPLHRVYYPLLEMQSMSKDLLKANNIDTCDFIVNCINSGYYIYLSVDTYYIPTYSSKEHSTHDLFLFGYDSDRKVFHAADFFNSHYTHEDIGFDSMKLAVESLGTGLNDFKDVQLLKINEKPINPLYSLDVEHLKNNLHDYLYEKDTSYRYKEFEGPFSKDDNRTWGLGVYNTLLKVLKEEIIPSVTLRSIHALYEHKKLMKMRVKFLIENNFIKSHSDLIDCFEKVEHDALIIRNVLLKSMHNNKHNDKVSILLEQLRISDRESIEKIIESIS
ncbi:hypothetical protein [Paenibacillus sp. IHBB 10380]|uniref:hypothetical protein n=1 Tax=Paenibacillus sp. IHBB 10380 TaxID=1566358 RepID=UPI0005CFB85C|nr:hypothetical protein [Paenibacillus sp. IHBB 10380]AJS57217.1 hypothetical protein UB51_00410 [Paenibacillus sp. IHBB 10380]